MKYVITYSQTHLASCEDEVSEFISALLDDGKARDITIRKAEARKAEALDAKKLAQKLAGKKAAWAKAQRKADPAFVSPFAAKTKTAANPALEAEVDRRWAAILADLKAGEEASAN